MESLGTDIIVVVLTMTTSGVVARRGSGSDGAVAVDMDAYNGHLRFATKRVFRHVKMPWEHTMKQCKVFHEMGSFETKPSMADWCHYKDSGGKVQPKPDVCVSSVPSKRLLASAMKKISWRQRLNDHRMAAVKRWLSIVEWEVGEFQFGKQWLQDQSYDLGNILSDVVASRATGTLHDRAGPILRFISWCKDRQLKPIPFNETLIYDFFNSMGDEVAATFPRSMLCAVAFCGHVLGCPSALGTLESKRLIGISSKFYQRKRRLRQRPPLQVAHVKALEAILCGNRKLPDKVAAGFFLWLVGARARFSDGQAAGKLSLDVTETKDGFKGFLHADVTRTKSSMTLEKKTRFLPMSSPIELLGDEPWALRYLQAMDDSGLERGEDKPLLPSPSESGWGSLPLSAESASAWLRSLLTTSGFSNEEVKCIGTHSCKVTGLSWAAKAALPKETREVLGYHGPRGSVYVYGRDNQAGPLREFANLLMQIKLEKFLPDATRSGYFEAGDERPQIEAEEWSSSEDSVDEECPEHVALEKATEKVVGSWDANIVDPRLDSAVFFRHVISRVLHVVEDESGASFQCGRQISVQFIRLSGRPPIMDPLCKQCFHRFKRG